MRLGVNLVNFGPGAAPEFLARWGQTVEALGYHFLMASDHVAITPDVQARYPAPFYDPFVTLAWLAGCTSKLGLGTTVAVLPYRHPLQIASMSEGIHRLSGGRFVLGVGVGSAKQEYAALGVPFEKRGAMTDDYLAAIRAVWDADGDVATHEGPFVSFENVRRAPELVRSPSSPAVWVGGSSEAALRRAVRFGDGWHPNNARLKWLEREGLPRLREIAREEGRPVPRFCPRVRLCLTESPLDEEQRLPGEGTLGRSSRTWKPWGPWGPSACCWTPSTATSRRRGTTIAPCPCSRRWRGRSRTSGTEGRAERASDGDRDTRGSKPTKERDETMGGEGSVRELRVALTAEDFEGAVALYGGALGLRLVKEWDEPHGRGAIFAAGAATLEVIDRPQAEYIDEVEVGERVSGPVRLALAVADVEQVAGSLRRHGAEAVGNPVTTPWGDFNQRLRAPDGMQLTLFGQDGG